MTETSSTNTDAAPTPLGAQVNSAYSGVVGVIGEIDQSMTGNTILRIGHHTIGERHWVSGAAHVVLTSDERERLITALIAHREAVSA